MSKIENLKFLKPDEIPKIADQFGTPVFIYDQATLVQRYRYFATLPNAFGLTIRYSVKANPNTTILRLYDALGACFDVSSVYEAQRLIRAGVPAQKILMTAQEASQGWDELCDEGMMFDAGSLRQLQLYGQRFPGRNVSIRINPGFGSGLVKKLTSGGSHSSFGIWYADIKRTLDIAAQYNIEITRLHFHIGSGHESTILEKTVGLALELCRQIPSVSVLDLGGGYRITSLNNDPTYDYHGMAQRIAERLCDFEVETGRKLKLELEPGTYLMSLAGSLITRIHDYVCTGTSGYEFLKIDGGLTELIRPSYYGALHPLVVVDTNGYLPIETNRYMVSGHCCIAVTPALEGNEEFAPQLLGKARIGDFLVIERAGGYAASMSIKNFNSYPEAAEVLRRTDKDYVLIRHRQTLTQILQNEITTTDGSFLKKETYL